MKLVSAVFVVLVAWSSVAQAQTCEPGTTVYYGNGVDNTYTDALLSLYRARRLYTDGVTPSRLANTQYDLAYNPTADLLADLAETFYMLADPEDRDIYLPEVQRLFKGFGLLAPKYVQPVAQLLSNAINSTSPAEISRVTSAHVSMYQRDLDSGRRVILLAHSQGNIFALQSRANFAQENRKYLSIMAVATPAAVTAGAYRTSDRDLVIAPLGAMASNVTNPLVPDYLLGHNFLNVYAEEGMPSRADIVSDLADLSLLTEFPDKCYTEKTETVTLELPFARIVDGARGAFAPQQWFMLDVPRFDPAMGQLVGATLSYELGVTGTATCPDPFAYPPANTCIAMLLMRDFMVGSHEWGPHVMKLYCDDQEDGFTSLCSFPFQSEYGLYPYTWNNGQNEISRSFAANYRAANMPDEIDVIIREGAPPTWRLDGYYVLRAYTSLGRSGNPPSVMETYPSLTSFDGATTLKFTIGYRYVPAVPVD